MPVDPRQIEEIVKSVSDENSFIQRLLIDGLKWEIPTEAEDLGEITYDWTPQELQIEGLEGHLADGVIKQIVLPDNPWGVFILEFKNPELFATGRGMTGPLRRLLRALVPKKRGSRPDQPVFAQENLLFICNHDYQHFRFAHFKAPLDTGKAAPLAAFGWGPHDPVRTVCEFNLPGLVWPENAPQDDAGWVECWGAAFDVEKVTKKFYRDYADTFDAFERYIEGRPDTGGLTGDDLRLWCQTLFNRLMFLRFIERKGWLTFPDQQGTNYLSALFEADGCGGESFFRGRLRPLFFEGLDVEGKQNAPAYGTVPFLNGGLFEKTDLDKRVKDIPDDAFQAILGYEKSGGLFYSYNFTVEESTPLDIEVAVDPEMLGKVFEELVTGRHKSGSYYTPRPVVSFMCREALKGFLSDKTKVTPRAVAALVDDHRIAKGFTVHHAREITKALSNLKVVDPACGSGAYLLGMLHELVGIYRLIYNETLTEAAPSLYDLKLGIISHNLYGVDIDRFATNIAMLRLWLSLAVEAGEPPALPNLDFKIETGDSLLGPDPHEVPDLFRLQLQARADMLAVLKDKFLNTHGPEKDDLRQAVIREEAIIEEELEAQVGRGIVDWRVQFADVFGRNNGFDIVVANPPYVRQELIDKEQKRRLVAAYADAFTGKSDLFCAFYARGFQLLRPGGLHAFICSNSWLDVGYGRVLQDYLLDRVADLVMYESSVERQFSTADINTIISIMRKAGEERIESGRFVRLDADFASAIHDVSLRNEVTVGVEHLREPAENGREHKRRSIGKWGGRFFRAPNSFHRYLSSDIPRVLLGKVPYWKLMRGRRTGCDSFFYLRPHQVTEYGIEKDYLRPLVKSPTQFVGVEPRTSHVDGDWFVFLCHSSRSDLTSTGALAYIEHGESNGYDDLNLAASHGRWYDLGESGSAEMILPIAFGNRIFVIENDAELEVHQRFATVRMAPNYRYLVPALCAILSSSLLAVVAETLGRRSLGQGALDFPPEDWKQVPIPDLGKLPDQDVESLRNLWTTVSSAPPVSSPERFADEGRRALDEEILRVIGINASLAQELLTDACEMLESRIAKARSVV